MTVNINPSHPSSEVSLARDFEDSISFYFFIAGKWKERRPEGKANRYPQFEDWEVPSKPLYQRHGKDGVWGIGAPNKDRVGEDDTMPRARWCVSNLCEMKKCERMTTEFKYMVSPKLEWTCVMAESKEKCMEKIFDGNADIMTADGEEIYTAGKKFALMPIVHTKEDHSNVPNYNSRFSKYEEADGSGLKHFTIALVKKTNLEVNSYQDMRQRKSCHPGVDMPATFKSPVCALIKEGVIPPIGNAYESAGEFFKESCVPGVQLDLFNPNMTNPENLCKLCKGVYEVFFFFNRRRLLFKTSYFIILWDRIASTFCTSNDLKPFSQHSTKATGNSGNQGYNTYKVSIR